MSRRNSGQSVERSMRQSVGRSEWTPSHLFGAALVLTLCSVFGGHPVAAQTTLTVPGDHATIQGAIDAASAGDTVLVSAGTYAEEIDFLGKDIEVVSVSGAATTIIDPSAAPPSPGQDLNPETPLRRLERRIDAYGWVRLVATSGENGSGESGAGGEDGSEQILVDTMGRGDAGSPSRVAALGNNGSVVVFEGGESRKAILDGFTIRGGDASSEGGGIRIQSGSSPTIRNNIVQQNTACSGGGGIGIAFSSPLIENNEISDNHQSGCSGGIGGGGISLRGAASPEIRGNTLSGNSFGTGGGISLFAAGTPTLENNLIVDNTAGSGGGGMDFANASNALMVQNVISGNDGGGGDGIDWLVPSGQPGPRLVNNTVVWNASVGIFADGFDAGTTLENNIIVGTPGQTAVECGDFNDTNSPQFDFNNVFADSGGTAYGGICVDPTGVDGNISADPLFVDPGGDDFRLAAGSSSVDVGNNSAADLPETDLDGNQRIFDGDGDKSAVVDQGAYEQGSEPPDPPGPTILLVPSEYATIQAAIDAAANGDQVRVAAGTYPETLDFLGKAITVISESGPAATTIDGTPPELAGSSPMSVIPRTVSRARLDDGRIEIVVSPSASFGPFTGSVVTFATAEGRASVLEGFTITGGNASFDGGGIRIDNASPTIRGNIITGNLACTGGAGIDVSFGSPLIENNEISNNHQTGCSGGQGGGIAVGGAASGSTEIRGNLISGNSFTFAGGIGFNAAGSPLVIDNRIVGNSASNDAGGLEMINASNVLIVQNRFEGNDSGTDEGEDLSWLVPSGQPGPRLVNNSFYATGSGPSLLLDGFDVTAEVSNNIVQGAVGAVAVECGDFNDPNPPIFSHNNVYSPSGTPYGGICGNPTGTDGNLSSDPLFVDPGAGDLHLSAGSPSIDTGDNTVMDLPDVDFEGEPRISDGDSNGQATVDQGADERQETPLFADGFESGDTTMWSSS